MPIIRAWIPAIHDGPFLLHYARKMNDYLIAEQMQDAGLKVTSDMVKIRRRQLDLPANHIASPAERVQGGPAPKFRPDPLAIALQWVAGFNRETMTLHGRPVKLPEIMKLANAQLKANGVDQVGPESWRV